MALCRHKYQFGGVALTFSQQKYNLLLCTQREVENRASRVKSSREYQHLRQPCIRKVFFKHLPIYAKYRPML